ncbi:MAG: GxxExxY protein [Candidatus Kapabacteria bacterium]|jgi:GxxExxY protein|nr:GxxExxY protein [Candidatus Kapabacteria bacterium]
MIQQIVMIVERHTMDKPLLPIKPKQDKVYKHSHLTGEIIACFYKVYNDLGYGFLEKCYEEAMMIELCAKGLKPEQQKSINVFYHGQSIGTFSADIVVNGLVILELKSVKQLLEVHSTQLVNYLRATDIEIGLLMNFGPHEAKVYRRVFDNQFKKSIHTQLIADKT